AYSYQQFVFRCLQHNLFRPARGKTIALEREIERYIDDHFPASRTMSMDVYRKGIRFAKVGRIEDAELALANGDSRFEQASYWTSDRREGSKGRRSKLSDKDVARMLLVRAIQTAKDARLNPPVEDARPSMAEPRRAESPDAEPVEDARPSMAEPRRDESPDAEPIDELARLRLDAARRDEARRERWERERELRRYVETDGKWMLVDQYLLRRGPRSGEVWVTFDEMQLIKSQYEQASLDIDAPPAPEKAATEPVLDRSERLEPLFVQVDGRWTEVDVRQRAAGPGPGIEWVTWSKRQLLETASALAAQQSGRNAEAAPPTEYPADVTFVTEMDGKWRFIRSDERAAGPKQGEVWLTLSQMRTEINRRQLEAWDQNSAVEDAQ
ncbi:MAG: hypothetical protein VCE43_20655, partial [Myxococcota bacterium]